MTFVQRTAEGDTYVNYIGGSALQLTPALGQSVVDAMAKMQNDKKIEAV